MSMTFPIKILLQGLYYPAVLGTVLVAWLLKIAGHNSFIDAGLDCTLYFGIIGLLYFSVSFLLMEDRSYNRWHPVLNIFEFVLIFVAFYFLGYFSPDDTTVVNWTMFYVLLAFVPVLGLIWNGLARFWDWTQASLAAIAIIVSFLAARFHPISQWVHRGTAIVLLVIVLLYLVSFSKTAEIEY